MALVGSAHHNRAPKHPSATTPRQTTCAGSGETSNLRQALWSAQPYSTIPSWAQVRAYSRRTGHAHSGPVMHVHEVFSQRATKGSGSTRGWQRANTDAVFRSWHCSHMACKGKGSSQHGPGMVPALATHSHPVPRRMAPREPEVVPSGSSMCLCPNRGKTRTCF